MPIEISDLESSRFHIVAARIVNPAASLDEIEIAARARGVQMLSVRLDVSDLRRVQAFEAAGYQLMDTLLYYGRPVDADLHDASRPEGVRCRVAEPTDAAGVAEVARLSFRGYVGHYHSDPRLDKAAADEAYVEWAETCTIRASETAPVLVAECEARIVGFLAMRLNGTAIAEIVLNAVSPAFRRRGIYHYLLSEASRRASAEEIRLLTVSTQINNYAVQRTWSRMGFFHYESFYTFHKWFSYS